MAIVLNEVVGSTTGADVEFVELFGDPGASLAGLSVIVVESDDIGANGAIDFRFDFGEDDALGGNGFFLLGNDLVEGVYGVTPDALIAGNAIENSSYTIALVETASLVGGSVSGGEVVLNAVGVTDGGATDSFFFDAPVVGPDGAFLPAGFSRKTPGLDTGQAADFDFADFNNSTAVNTPTAAVFENNGAPQAANVLDIAAVGSIGLNGAEIVDVDPASDRAFVTSGDGLNVIDASDPASPVLIATLDPADFGFNSSEVTSATVKNDIVAVSLPDDEKTENGDVLFFRASTLEFLGSVEVGALPDALFFNDAGTHIVVANEGESDGGDNEPDELPNPNGSVSIIAIDANDLSSSAVTTLDFSDPSITFASLAAKGVRVNRDAPSAAADLEPEYATISGDKAFITLQENNAVAVIEDITNPTPFTIDSIQPLGLVNHGRGAPSLETFDFEDLPLLGTDANGLDIDLGGFSGLFFKEETDTSITFVTVPDRGPNGGEVVDGARTFNLPDYQARVIEITLDKATGVVSIGDTIFLTRDDNGEIKPITGLPNIAGFDEVPVDAAGDPLDFDPFGADMEGVVIDDDGSFWMVDEYRPAIYHFDAAGLLIDRFVPEGTSLLGDVAEPEGTFGTETLPEVYNLHRANRGFEAVAANLEEDKLYAFIQTPIQNPDRATSDASQVIRILEIDMNTGAPTGEYVYLLEDAGIRPGGRVDKIGDAVFDPATGNIFVVERDSEFSANAVKPIYEIDLSGATNVLGLDDFNGETLEQLTPDRLAEEGIVPVFKVEVVNPPSLGYTASDKIEGLALLPDGSLAILNDNDFGIEEAAGLLPQLGVISFEGNALDPSNEDGGVNIANFDILGVRAPDAIASYVVDGVTYYVTANEGDGRDVDESRGADLVDGDPDNGEVDANISQTLKDQLADEALLGRLHFSNVDGDIDGDGDIDVLHSFGSRSFTIFDEFGNVVFDSGDDFELITAELVPELFNSNGDADSFDSRSDDKGPEPEAVTIGEIDGLTYAFVGLERVGGVMVYDITDPTDVKFDQYVRNEGDIAPEGLKFISAEDSPTGVPLLAVASEESQTLTFFSLTDDAPLVTIMDIQGAGHVSPFVLGVGQTVEDFFDALPPATFNVVGDTVKTTGVVTAVDTNGFYLQDPTGDGDDATSDAIFVFTSGAPGVNVGDGVTVTGEVKEFFPGDTDERDTPLTQLGADVADVIVTSTGNALPAAVIIGANGRLPVDVNFDDDAFGEFDPVNDGLDFFESLEAMLVTAEDVVAVASTNRFGEIFGVVDNGVGASGVSARGTLNISETDFNPEKIQIDEDSGVFDFDFPDVTVGANLGDVTGVVSYSFGNYEILPTVDFTPNITNNGLLDPEITEIGGGDDRLTVASYNVLNLEPNDNDGDTDVADGRFTAIANQIVANLGAPDIIGLQEIQDNSGSVDDGVVAANLTLQLLVDEIVAAGGPQYAFIDNAFIADNQSGGQPGGNIRTAFLFDPSRVEVDEASIRPVGAQGAGEAFDGARLPLAADFIFNGETITVVNNHFSSKGGSAPVMGIEQDFAARQEDPSVNGSLDERRVQAQAVNDFVDGVLAENADAKVVVLGDLNEFEFASPLDILAGTATTTNGFDLTQGGEPILTNLIESIEDGERYSFIFQGNSQELDHILVSDSLLEGAEIDIVHVNTEFVEDAGRGSDHDPVVASLTIPPVDNVFTLQLLHASDLEGGVEAIADAPNFAAIVEAFESEFADNTIVLSAGDNYLSGPFFSASNDQAAFRDSGVFNDVYNAFFGLDPLVDDSVYDSLREGGGRVDVSIMNLIGFDASAIGNHEFDLGSDIFQTIIEEDFRGGADGPAGDRWVGAQFPYLSANLDFSEDPFLGGLFTPEILLNTAFQTGPDQSNAGETDVPKIAPATLVEVDGELIGVVGATTQVLEQISSPSGATVIGPNANDMEALAAILQPTIDATIAAGTNKVILVSHLQQFQLEQALVGFLEGVDIIIAGGSDTIVADAEGEAGDDRLRAGDEADVSPYPFVGADADGNPVAIVSTDGEYAYVGRLVIDFDEDGHIIVDSIDRTESGAFATDEQGVADVFGVDESEIDAVAFAEGTNAELVKRLVDAAKDVVEAKDGNVFGETEVFLDGNRESVRTEETNLGNLTADANLSEARKVDPTTVLSLKNGGGVRAAIGEVDQDGNLLPPQANPDAGKLEGQISQLDIENALKFNNGLSLVTLTAEELLQVMEHAVSATAPGVTPGQFPQIGGFAFTFDATQPAGARIETIALLTEDGEVGKVIVLDGEVVVPVTTTFRMVTLNFLADGGDGYPFPELSNPDRVDLFALDAPDGEVEDAEFAAFGTEQDALAEFLAENHGVGADTPFGDAETDPEDDFRIQNLELRDDGVLDEISITGNNRDNELIGSDLVDLINGRGGDDLLRGQGDDDILLGGDGDDILHGQDGDDSAYGQDGDDLALGGDGDDRVDGGDGDDRIYAQDGDDLAFGGDGDDTVLGGDGDDVIEGGAGDDKLLGQEGDDELLGGDGDDELRGDAGDDVIDGGDGDDRIKGGEGDDTVLGGAGDDAIREEGDGDDDLDGGAGDDFIVAGAGEDTVKGGDGDDDLFGGLGNDLLVGGDGVDVFHFNRADAAATGEGFNGDFIADFENKVDELDLGGLNIVGFESDDFNDDGAIDIGLITDVDDFTIVILGTPLDEVA